MEVLVNYRLSSWKDDCSGRLMSRRGSASLAVVIVSKDRATRT